MKLVNITKASLIVLMVVFCIFLNDQTSAIEGGYCPVSTIQETVEYPENWNLEWDPSNPDEIDRNDSVALKVIGGYPPYAWSVNGAGFTLVNDITQGLSNTLNADSTACVATVTVTDSRGISVSGDVRCRCGGWVSKGEICGLAGTYDSKYYDNWVSGDIYTKVQGNQKQTQTVIQVSNLDCDQYNCGDSCTWNDGSGNFRCNKSYGCEPCIAGAEALCDGGYCHCTMSRNYSEYECPAE